MDLDGARLAFRHPGVICWDSESNSDPARHPDANVVYSPRTFSLVEELRWQSSYVSGKTKTIIDVNTNYNTIGNLKITPLPGQVVTNINPFSTLTDSDDEITHWKDMPTQKAICLPNYEKCTIFILNTDRMHTMEAPVTTTGGKIWLSYWNAIDNEDHKNLVDLTSTQFKYIRTRMPMPDGCMAIYLGGPIVNDHTDSLVFSFTRVHSSCRYEGYVYKKRSFVFYAEDVMVLWTVNYYQPTTSVKIFNSCDTLVKFRQLFLKLDLADRIRLGSEIIRIMSTPNEWKGDMPIEIFGQALTPLVVPCVRAARSALPKPDPFLDLVSLNALPPPLDPL